jgi:hypothetical protein
MIRLLFLATVVLTAYRIQTEEHPRPHREFHPSRFESWTDLSRDLISAVVHLAILKPSRFFYIWFPHLWNGIGGWGGAHEPDICAALTGVASSHWVQNENLCSKHIDRRAYSIAAAVVAPLYFYSVFSFTKTCIDKIVTSFSGYATTTKPSSCLG